MDHWDHLQPHLRQMLGDEEYGTWIAPLAVLENSDGALTLTTENLIVRDWVRDHLLRDIETVARSHFGSAFRVMITPQEGSDAPAVSAPPPPPRAASQRIRSIPASPLSGLLLARQTSSRPRRPKPSPIDPERRTTLFTSTAGRVSAKPTFSTPSPTASKKALFGWFT